MKRVLLSVAILSAGCMINGAEVPGDPLSLLPPELVSEILKKMSSQGATMEEYISSMLRLREVNMLWYALITPKLIGRQLKGEVEQGNFKQDELENVFLAVVLAGNHVMVDILLNAGVDVELQYKYEKTALMLAAQAGHTEVVRLIIEKWGANVNAVDDFHNTVLMAAAKTGRANVAQLLLDRGANINEVNLAGYTALMLAVSKDNANVVQLLLDRGADSGVKDKLLGETALMIASGHSRTETGSTKVVQLLLDRGANINEVNLAGYTALMLAVLKGTTNVVQLFLDRGADINVENKDGETALMLAVFRGTTNVVQLLLDGGANINIQNNEGNTALMLAVINRRTKIENLLRQAEAQR